MDISVNTSPSAVGALSELVVQVCSETTLTKDPGFTTSETRWDLGVDRLPLMVMVNV